MRRTATAGAFGIVVGLGSFHAARALAPPDPDTIVPTLNYSTACYNGSIGASAVCRSDNRTLTWFYESSVPGSAQSIISSVVTNKYDANTVLTASFESPPAYTGSAETDLIYRQGSVTGSDQGITWCDDASDGTTNECDQQYIQIEPGDWNTALVCHETGHGVGLLHGPDSFPGKALTAEVMKCMKKPVASTDTNLGANNQDNIDYVY